MLVQAVGLLAVMLVALFIPAGTLAWPAGWIFVVGFFSFFLAVSAWLGRSNPSLLAERLRLGTTDQQGWDKLLFPLLQVLVVAWLALMGLDAVRFHWSYMPVWLQGVGALCLLDSFYVLLLTFRENSYLSPVIRLQSDRGQSVVSTGPYGTVRHPMYAGILIFMVGTALMLGSWFGVAAVLLVVALLARRAVLEERMLRQSLAGYEAYMGQVRYRFIPFVW